MRLYLSRIAAKRKCYREECVTNQFKYRRDISRTLPFPQGGGVEGTATCRVRLSTEHCQSFFINATSKLVTKLQATRD